MGSATILARFGEDKYPIDRFILDRARALGLSRRGLVRRLGYRELAGAHKALSSTLLTGVITPLIEHHLAGALETDETLVRAVIAATRRQKRDEACCIRNDRDRAYRASCRPHLQIQTERIVPSPIFIAALLTVARLRIIRLPDEAITADEDARNHTIKAIILDHWRETGGRVPAFGGITGYFLVIIAGYGGDFGLPYNVAGDPAGGMRKVERLGEASLGIRRGDTRLTGLLKDVPIRAIRASEDN
jgi:hypothetical protein